MPKVGTIVPKVGTLPSHLRADSLVRAVRTDRSPVTVTDEASDNDIAPVLTIITPDGVFCRPLERGDLMLGRGPEADVLIDDVRCSRAHAAIHVTDAIEIEDLGSQNGTFVNGRRLKAHVRTRLAFSRVVEIGSVMLVVQRTRPKPLRGRSLGSHAQFEFRVAQEIARDLQPQRISFAVVLVHVEGGEPDMIRRVLTEGLGSTDAISAYAPGEYEVLLCDVVRKRAEARATALVQNMGTQGAEARFGLAMYPRDGGGVDALLATANATLRGNGTKGSDVVAPSSEAMRSVYRLAEQLGRGRISVLLLSETGAGKEVVAAAIHRFSPRRQRRFVRLNCAAISEALAESELFGYERGAFTGADEPKVGLLEAAGAGTVFLDEIGELPLSIQAKLLRAIEQREVQRVGSVTPRPIDVRFISATNRDLETEVEAGRFRSDLFYRLNGASIVIAPLRERIDEIAPLAEFFVDRFAKELGLIESPTIGEAALDMLHSYSWPGNVRELRNVMERAVLLCDGEHVDVHHLPIDKLSARWESAKPPVRVRASTDRGPGRDNIVDALEACAGNQSRAAEMLGISRRTLTKWLTRYDVPRPLRRKG